MACTSPPSIIENPVPNESGKVEHAVIDNNHPAGWSTRIPCFSGHNTVGVQMNLPVVAGAQITGIRTNGAGGGQPTPAPAKSTIALCSLASGKLFSELLVKLVYHRQVLKKL